LRDITERKTAEAELRQAIQIREELVVKTTAQAQQLEEALQDLQQTQTQLIQTEKMSSLGQLVAGVAHEINNPVNFIYGNLVHADSYVQNLIALIQLYERQQVGDHPEITNLRENIDLDFVIADLPKTLSSMRVGADRIRQIVLTLRNFSRLDEAEMKPVDIHEGIDSTLLILQNRLKEKSERSAIQIIKDYGELPAVECYAGQLNQVFMNILSNAIDAIEEHVEQLVPDTATDYKGEIVIQTQVSTADRVIVRIRDNGPGIPEVVQARLFDPFFTTKPVGQGTGLGLSISYKIVVEKHGGDLKCISEAGRGTEFWIEIPKQQCSNVQ
jgi:signal transduction histidine kinase